MCLYRIRVFVEIMLYLIRKLWYLVCSVVRLFQNSKDVLVISDYTPKRLSRFTYSNFYTKSMV